MLDVLSRGIKKVPILRGKTIITLFYESSTRTRVSFEQAGKILSADVINISENTSSTKKGESLFDRALSIQAMKADIVVIGGGPAGSAAATMLARKGWQVTVLEREQFPRDHVGESLLPASIPVLEELGALPAVESAGFLPKHGATMVWGSGDAPWSWYFKETSKRYPHSYQVWRPQFDQILLDNAKAQGVTVLEGHKATEVIFDGDEAVGVEFTDTQGQPGGAQCRFVVDASGQSTLLARYLKSKKWDPFFRNLAIYAYFTNVKLLPEPDQNNIFIESYRYGWLWSIPLHTGRTLSLIHI